MTRLNETTSFAAANSRMVCPSHTELRTEAASRCARNSSLVTLSAPSLAQTEVIALASDVAKEGCRAKRNVPIASQHTRRPAAKDGGTATRKSAFITRTID